MNILMLFMGFYLVLIGYEGNGTEFYASILQDKGFLWWMLGLFIFYLLWKNEKMRETMDIFGVLVFTALLLKSYPTVQQEFNVLKTWISSPTLSGVASPTTAQGA